jgi:hypothetical protein
MLTMRPPETLANDLVELESESIRSTDWSAAARPLAYRAVASRYALDAPSP